MVVRETSLPLVCSAPRMLINDLLLVAPMASCWRRRSLDTAVSPKFCSWCVAYTPSTAALYVVVLPCAFCCFPCWCFCSLFPPTSSTRFPRCLHAFPFVDRCGQEEQDPVRTQQYLYEFARRNWRNKGFRQLTYNLFPPPHAFREQTVRIPPQDLTQPGTIKLMPVVEEILGSYTAVRV